jgi:hypothetical protein
MLSGTLLSTIGLSSIRVAETVWPHTSRVTVFAVARNSLSRILPVLFLLPYGCSGQDSETNLPHNTDYRQTIMPLALDVLNEELQQPRSDDPAERVQHLGTLSRTWPFPRIEDKVVEYLSDTSPHVLVHRQSEFRVLRVSWLKLGSQWLMDACVLRLVLK